MKLHTVPAWQGVEMSSLSDTRVLVMDSIVLTVSKSQSNESQG